VTALFLAACLAGCAAWVASGASAAELRLRRLTGVQPRGARLGAGFGAVAVLVVAGGVVLSLFLRSAVPMLAAPVLAYALRRWRSVVGRAAAAERNRAAVAEVCAAFGAELRASRQPVDALIRAAAGGGAAAVIARAHAAAASGGDIVVALRADAEQPGAEALRRLAACWRVAHGRGAGLAAAVDRVVGALHSEQEHRRDVAAELAGARATARILAALPVIGLLMGIGLGADPVHVLLRTPYGVGCLVAGVALVGAGLLWTERIARTAEQAG
jgi:tight adherence protein B